MQYVLSKRRIFVKSHDGNIKDIHKETDLIGF